MLLFLARVFGHSMEPTFFANDRLLVSSIPYWFSEPKIGEIIVFSASDKKLYIKRIVKIKNKLFYVEGDNPGDSKDSRKIGCISKSDIVGKVICKIEI